MIFSYFIGFGDIVPVSDSGRAIIFVWTIIGTGLWCGVIGAITSRLLNWVYNGLILNTLHCIKGKDEDDVELNELGDKIAKPMIEEQVLTWWVLLTLNIVAIVLYLTVHLIGAAGFQSLEPSLGNLPNGGLTDNSYGNILYYSVIASQTMCTIAFDYWK